MRLETIVDRLEISNYAGEEDAYIGQAKAAIGERREVRHETGNSADRSTVQQHCSRRLPRCGRDWQPGASASH